jgi:hypothetical protein
LPIKAGLSLLGCEEEGVCWPGGDTLGFAFDQDTFPTQYGLPNGASAGV